ncbi:MAG: hypothetical protein H7138_08485 [Myxococcales bacterium]|nr:hypothetical protein [Myxococcales bacterium]
MKFARIASTALNIPAGPALKHGMRLLVVALLVAAVGPSAAEPRAPSANPVGGAGKPSKPAAPSAWSAPDEPRDRFKLLTKGEQAKAQAAIEAKFPPRWRAKAKVDHAGFIAELAVTVPTPITDADAIERTIEVVGHHPAAFGVLDPRALRGQRSRADVHLGEGERWTGNIIASYDARRLRIYGHLWPVETPRPVELDRAKLLEKYLGLRGTRPSKCDCARREDELVLDLESFTVDAGIAMVCKDGELRPRPAIAMRAEIGSATVPGLEDMPRLVDAETRERIDDDFLMPPYGEGEPTSREIDAVHAFMTNRCFYR